VCEENKTENLAIIKLTKKVHLKFFESCLKLCDSLRQNKLLKWVDCLNICFVYDLVQIFQAFSIQIVGKYSKYLLEYSLTLVISVFFKRNIGKGGMEKDEALNRIGRLIFDGNSSKFKEFGKWSEVKFNLKKIGEIEEFAVKLDRFSNTAFQMVLSLLSKLEILFFQIEDNVTLETEIERKNLGQECFEPQIDSA